MIAVIKPYSGIFNSGLMGVAIIGNASIAKFRQFPPVYRLAFRHHRACRIIKQPFGNGKRRLIGDGIDIAIVVVAIDNLP